MVIRILRSTVVLVDGAIRPVDAGESIEVDARVAATLIGLGKAVIEAPAGPGAPGKETPEAAPPPIEVRGKSRRGK